MTLKKTLYNVIAGGFLALSLASGVKGFGNLKEAFDLEENNYLIPKCAELEKKIEATNLCQLNEQEWNTYLDKINTYKTGCASDKIMQDRKNKIKEKVFPSLAYIPLSLIGLSISGSLLYSARSKKQKPKKEKEDGKD